MSLVLVDSSAWVEFDRDTPGPVNERLRHLIESTDDVAVTEPVVMEITAGARDDQRESDLRRLLTRFHLLPFDAPVDFAGATRIYRCCRSVGVAPRGLVDCMIAAVAWRNGASLLCQDADLVRIAEVIEIPLDAASR
jgi:predicted nucleic acid-binding protein